LPLLFCAAVSAQSVDLSAPSPVQTNEVTATIVARDIGDARFTDHYYTFIGNPGDLLVTVQSQNLNGDIDVFTAVGLRPLLKVTVYAEISSQVTKSIFLRARQELILRVEARTPNDDSGSYRIAFGGSFEALAAKGEEPATPAEATAATAPKGRRVTSAGARIKEPEPPPVEVATATPEPTPAVETEKPKETTTPTTPAPRESRRRAGARRSNPRTRPTPTEDTRTDVAAAEEKKTEATETKPPETAEPTPKPRATKRSTTRARPTKPTEVESAVQEPETGPWLIIETAEGTFVNRSMSTVRRVMVENGQVVVVGKDGVSQRIPLASVVKMTIAP
jgi:hypothetical protein